MTLIILKQGALDDGGLETYLPMQRIRKQTKSYNETEAALNEFLRPLNSKASKGDKMYIYLLKYGLLKYWLSTRHSKDVERVEGTGKDSEGSMFLP